MIDWKLGGWTGSINRYVQREVSKHMRQNPTIRRARYSWRTRFLHSLYAGRSLSGFVSIYLVVCLTLVFGESLLSTCAPTTLSTLFPFVSADSDSESVLNMFAGYAITAQVGVLGVISIAVGLMALIAQRQGAGTDVRVYYHASLAFEVVASCISLLLVLCVQIIWPLHLAVHQFGWDTDVHISKLLLLGLHIVWLVLNLAAMAHFVATTFRFVQQSARQELREVYTANAVLPVEMTRRMRQALYSAAGTQMLRPSRRSKEVDSEQQAAHFGMNYGQIELYRTFKSPAALHNVHVSLVQWVVRCWLKRCERRGGAEAQSIGGLRPSQPALFFPIHLDYVIRGKTPVCNRSGGVALNWVEKLVLTLAFRFRRAND